MKHETGFTILELMVVVAVIGILAAIAVPQYQNYIRKSQFAEVINMTSAIKISDALCMKEYNQKIGCSGGTNNVVADITPLNTTKYTLSVVTQDGVITATARGPNDAAAIAAVTAAVGLPPAPTAIESVAPTKSAGYFAPLGSPAIYSTPESACIDYLTYGYSGWLKAQGFSFISVGPPMISPGSPTSGQCFLTPFYNGNLYNGPWQLIEPVCPNPTSGAAYTFNQVSSMCERPNPNPPAASTGNPGTSLNNETYILNPTIDATGKITYTVGGTCLLHDLCQAN